MTTEELHNPYTVPFELLGNVRNYVGNTHCKVCDTTTFLTHKDMVVRYHKGIKNTLVYLGNDKWEINDIVVRQDGEIFADWDFTNKTLLPTCLLRDNTKEIMQRSRERMVEIASTPYTTCGGYGGCGGGATYYVRTCGGIYEESDGRCRGGCGGGCSSCG